MQTRFRSLARPGGNLTGISFLTAELVAKGLELLHDLVPQAARVAVLVNPANVAYGALRSETRTRLLAPGLQIHVLRASTSREIDTAFETLARERPDALFVAKRCLLSQPTVQIVQLAAHHSIPAAYTEQQFPEIGGLMSYGTSIVEAVSPDRRLCRPHPQGRETGRPAGAAADQVRVCRSISRPPRRSASTCRRRCSPAPTR